MYPMKFIPIFQERLWGGVRLKTVLGKPLPPEQRGKLIGESWELADLKPGTVKAESHGANADGSLSNYVSNGPWKGQTLRQVLEGPASAGQGSQVMGKASLLHGRFPLLVKFLDAQADLSVQVHPDADYCRRHPDAHLKNEAWYILYAEPGAKIYKGLKPGVTRERFQEALTHGQVEPLLQTVKVKAGDCHYLQSGMVHALGAGILVAEVQTPSDTTFRVFDWNRLGPDGKPRQLHVAEALETIRFGSEDKLAGGLRSHVASVFTTVSRLITCPYFTLERVRMAAEFAQEIPYAEPVVWIVLEGQGVIQCEGVGPTAIARGEVLLLPANMKKPRIKTVTDCAWLEARLPQAG